MAGKVFISCGQNSTRERGAASALARLFTELGFTPWLAIEVHTIFDLNAKIINELKSSDLYVFVNLGAKKFGKVRQTPSAALSSRTRNSRSPMRAASRRC